MLDSTNVGAVVPASVHRIKQIEPWLDFTETQEVLKVMNSTYIVEASATKNFESLVRQETKSDYAVSMTNGTVALYSCFLALGLKPGDKVIVPDMTFVATANAAIMAGLIPVVCDVTNDNYCLDPDKILVAIQKYPDIKAIVPVHLYGQSADMTRIVDIAKRYGLLIVEDAAQGIGVRWKNQHVGTIGHAGILSFYSNKTITTGEGGVILTQDEEIAKSCYRLKNHGRDRKGIFVHDEIGFNFSFTEMQAAIGIAQMRKLQNVIDHKKAIYEFYKSSLEDISNIKFADISADITPVHWFTSIHINDKKDLVNHLANFGNFSIQTREFFYPLHLQPCYKKHPDKIIFSDTYENSVRAYETGLSLPSACSLTWEDASIVVEKIRKYYGK